MTLEERVDALEKEVEALQTNLVDALELVRSVVAPIAEAPDAPASITEQIRVGREAAKVQRVTLLERKETT